jgi:hypothetical protein
VPAPRPLQVFSTSLPLLSSHLIHVNASIPPHGRRPLPTILRRFGLVPHSTLLPLSRSHSIVTGPCTCTCVPQKTTPPPPNTCYISHAATTARAVVTTILPVPRTTPTSLTYLPRPSVLAPSARAGAWGRRHGGPPDRGGPGPRAPRSRARRARRLRRIHPRGPRVEDPAPL